MTEEKNWRKKSTDRRLDDRASIVRAPNLIRFIARIAINMMFMSLSKFNCKLNLKNPININCTWERFRNCFLCRPMLNYFMEWAVNQRWGRQLWCTVDASWRFVFLLGEWWLQIWRVFFCRFQKETFSFSLPKFRVETLKRCQSRCLFRSSTETRRFPRNQ